MKAPIDRVIEMRNELNRLIQDSAKRWRERLISNAIRLMRRVRKALGYTYP